jgi:hypothetical protein
MIKPLQSVAFFDAARIPEDAFKQGRVATQFGNTSGCGTRNDWCEVRGERSALPLVYHIFPNPKDAEKYCIMFGTATETDPAGMRRFDYLMGRKS